MIKPTTLARPFGVLLVIFTLIRLVASFQGVPYENTRVASISLLNLGFLAAALTAALARGLGGLSLKGAAQKYGQLSDLADNERRLCHGPSRRAL